jgi:hypothetical protein
MTFASASRFGSACLCILWAWLCLHTLTSFLLAWREERELRVEARLLLDGACGLPRSFPIRGVLIRCEEARAAMHRVPLVEAAKRVAGAVLQDISKVRGVGFAPSRGLALAALER